LFRPRGNQTTAVKRRKGREKDRIALTEVDMFSRPMMLVILSTALSQSPVATQASQCIALRIDLPTGKPQESRTGEGRRAVGVQLQDGQDYRDFYLDLTIRDLSLGVVLVTIRDDERQLDEFEMRVGGIAIQVSTSPSFGLSLLSIYEQTGLSCLLDAEGRILGER
jgi:hypothetical protein